MNIKAHTWIQATQHKADGKANYTGSTSSSSLLQEIFKAKPHKDELGTFHTLTERPVPHSLQATTLTCMHIHWFSVFLLKGSSPHHMPVSFVEKQYFAQRPMKPVKVCLQKWKVNMKHDSYLYQTKANSNDVEKATDNVSF